ncbi:hypothetical protein [Kingella denitrificans]|uniref:hypothetical protein n=1 Tax=Kingella denitrificans TaxID=502 RepID=UPI00164A22B3|nr:hypothetical protein [Kingella denitrificans]
MMNTPDGGRDGVVRGKTRANVATGKTGVQAAFPAMQKQPAPRLPDTTENRCYRAF